MASDTMEHFMITVLSIIFSPAIFLISAVIMLAGLGKSLGVRDFYIKTLLSIFEWGRLKIETHENKVPIDPALLQMGVLPNGEGGHVIEKEGSMYSEGRRTDEDEAVGFQLSDPMDFCKKGIEAIIEDDVTQRFGAEELPSWNLLTRTNTYYQFISVRLTILWVAGFFLRYFVLFPARAILAVFAIGMMVVGTAILGYAPDGGLKRWANYRLSVTCYRIMARAFTAVITFHNPENKAKGGGICVANHTSPIDTIILGCDNCYAMVGQAQGGFMGIMQRAMSRATSHIWFQRSEVKERLAVANRLRAHVEDTLKLPILIFPEGTCINNTSIMMFKKGSFEVGGKIYPAAIKYDSRFADPFWNSSEQSLSTHLLMILTSWALVCDVWYLPPQVHQEEEDAVHFANRVKADIARQGGLVDLDWDGGLKRSHPKPSMKLKQQEEYSKMLKVE